MKKVYFVSGIDTDAGKSYATGILAAAWQEEGINIITQKFIQTGCKEGISEDIQKHRELMGIDLLPEDIDHTTAPIRLSYPASPDLAARIDNVTIDLTLVERSTKQLLKKYDTVLIEGAGGLMVPIDGFYTTIDYIEEKELPLIFVTNPKLGSVSQTLLALEAVISRGIDIEYLVYNHYSETSPEITKDTRLYFMDYLAEYLPECEFIEIPNLA